MTRHADKSITHLEVVPSKPEQQPILANLLELYAHDFSEFIDIALGADGRFGYKDLPLYWSEADRYPFLINVDGKLAGFVLMKRGSEVSGNEKVWDMAEFFVLRGYRRHGIGTEVARQIWKQFPGHWEVRVMQSNHSAHQFWERAIAAFMQEAIHSVQVEKGSKRWHLFSFESKPAA